ncbi:MAG: hypothetical protein ABJB69_09650 [Spartobacteria bacterium]
MIVSAQVRDFVVEHFEVNSLGHVDLAGLPKAVELFAVTGPADLKAGPLGVRTASV